MHDVADEHHLEAGQAVVAQGAALEYAVALGKTSVVVGVGEERIGETEFETVWSWTSYSILRG